MQEARRSEKARTKPRQEEKKKRHYDVNEHERHMKFRREDRKKRDSEHTKMRSRNDPRTQTRKKVFLAMKYSLACLVSNFNCTFTEMP